MSRTWNNTLNSKFEARNTKQIQMTEIQNSKQYEPKSLSRFGHLII